MEQMDRLDRARSKAEADLTTKYAKGREENQRHYCPLLYISDILDGVSAENRSVQAVPFFLVQTVPFFLEL
jgi:hypothetical protein